MTKKYIALLASAFLVVIDQIVKVWAEATLTVRSIEVIPGLFDLTYIPNSGAAWGIFAGKTIFLIVLVSAVLLAVLGFLLSKRTENPLMIWALGLVLAGGIGNLIDRIRLGYVIDYLDFRALFNFPVFNFADCCVVAGTFLILIYVLFFDQPQPQVSQISQEEDNV